jgi:hypothetical protein
MKQDSRLRDWSCQLLVAAMLACLVYSVVEFLQRNIPGWGGMHIVALCVAAALEAPYAHYLVRKHRMSGGELVRFRAIELLTFFLLIKAGSYVGQDWASVLADIKTWPSQPTNLLNTETVAAFALLFISWLAATHVASDLERIGEPPERTRHYVSPLDSIAGLFFGGGVAIVIVASMTRVSLLDVLQGENVPTAGLILNVLVYFVLGLALLGQVRAAMLLTGWRDHGVKAPAGLSRSWVRYSLTFIGLAAFLAFLLPTGYSIGLFKIVETLIMIVSYAVVALYTIILIPIGWLLSKLFQFEIGPGAAAPAFPTPPPAPPGATPGAARPYWFELLKSLGFWVVAIGMIVYVLRSYLHDRPEMLAVVRGWRPIRWLRDLFAALRGRLTGLARTVSERLPRLTLRSARRRGADGPLGFFRLGALSPRERVYYYYLSILRRAGQVGLERHAAQTPYEYDATLEPHLPDAQEEMQALTRAFVEARYSRRDPDHEQVGRLRGQWERLKAALRKRKSESANERISE